MNNEQALTFWKDKAKSDFKKYGTKLNQSNDFTQYDADFIRPYLGKNKSLLDLGSGEGLLVNKIFKEIGFLTAVEPFEQFSTHIVRTPNVEVITSLIQDYKPVKHYDIITIFGVMQYFDRTEAKNVYKMCWDTLNTDGLLIVKNQFGIEKDKLVSGYSEEIGKDYYSEYRKLENEIAIMAEVGFKDIKAFDIYPPEKNRWPDTHFYAIVGYKK